MYTLRFSLTDHLFCRVPTPPGKTWKVLDFSPKISSPWKVLENEFNGLFQDYVGKPTPER